MHAHCPTHKRSYQRRNQARKALRHMASFRGNPYGKQRIYRCPLCGNYHLTHQAAHPKGTP